jgi:acetyl esterase/lipase
VREHQQDGQRGPPPGGQPGRPSRRALLAGGLGVALLAAAGGGYELIQDGTLPGKYTLARLDGACGSPPPAPRGPRPVRRLDSFYSAYRRRQVTMVTLSPAGAPAAAGLGVVVVLHGFGGDATGMANTVSAAMTAARIRTAAAITVDGGNTYWHDRADGDDPVGMILHEVLPRAAAAGLATARIAVAGESMGGYGALLLAEQLAPGAGKSTAAGPVRIAAVAAVSPAIFATYPDAIAANRGSFDSAADFARNDVQARIAALRLVPAWVSAGDEDPFRPQTELFRDKLATLTRKQPAGAILPGCHDGIFFDRNMPAALNFAVTNLANHPSGTGK